MNGVDTVAAPDDAAGGDGFYTLFLAGAGKYTLRASAPGHATGDRATRVRTDRTVRANLRLRPTPTTSGWGFAVVVSGCSGTGTGAASGRSPGHPSVRLAPRGGPGPRTVMRTAPLTRRAGTEKGLPPRTAIG
ncbi:hypothetical protein [Streptomyces fagopyri]|uniref:hypothetical protein n=1 Tax=Streptomyces fagopyri TaxID=2662397 RepID=UPI003403EC2E